MLTKILPKNAKIAVAVSGGVDSVVLLDRLVALSAKQGFSLSVVHCEHGIRGQESVEDSAFVRGLAEKYGLPFVMFSEDCPALAVAMGVSLETAARAFRYRVFERLLADGGADYIALAHHLDDGAETALFRLCRGTSIGGVQGMQAVSGRYLRPLLDESKEEILAYAAANGLAYRTDKTNFERTATRNVLRLDVMPVLEQAIPGTKENLTAFAQQAKEDDEFLCALAERLVQTVNPENEQDTGWRVCLGEMPLVRRACLMVLQRLGVEKDYTRKHLSALEGLFSLQTGAKVSLPKGLAAVRRYDNILFQKEEEIGGELPCVPFQKGEFVWGRYALTVSDTPVGGALFADGDKLAGAVIRGRREGDTFRKFGGGEKPLKKYLIDKKIPQGLRDGLPILAVGERVLAVFGVEISEDVKVTNATKNTVYLAVKEK